MTFRFDPHATHHREALVRLALYAATLWTVGRVVRTVAWFGVSTNEAGLLVMVPLVLTILVLMAISRATVPPRGAWGGLLRRARRIVDGTGWFDWAVLIFITWGYPINHPDRTLAMALVRTGSWMLAWFIIFPHPQAYWTWYGKPKVQPDEIAEFTILPPDDGPAELGMA